MSDVSCYHCGASCKNSEIVFDNKSFCCNGCKTVFEILHQNDLNCYYDFESAPGSIPTEIKGKFDYLDNQDIVLKLLQFDDGNTAVVEFVIPSIHCSSCIWVLENLHKLNNGIKSTQVNFPKKTLSVTFVTNKISLKQLVILITSIGYEPYISLEDVGSAKSYQSRKLIYQVAVAGFAFGNIMLMSFPEYFQMDGFWLSKYKLLFRSLMVAFAIPVVVYSAKDYFISAYKGLKHKILNIDVPIALGISVLFIRSLIDVVFDLSQGYFDSLAGLVFFLLLGKIFQQKTYNYLSFERDYKSYFPIAITKINKDGTEAHIPVYDIKKGDRLLIRHQELIPVDGILINGLGQLDYSFVTGESAPVSKNSGDKVFAGGKQMGEGIEIEVLQLMSQSYLTQLWSHKIFDKTSHKSIKTLTDSISKWFTFIILAIAMLSSIYWYRHNITTAFNVFTAVLIIACPCALALAAPFALGNILRLFGNDKLYLKNAQVVESLAKIDTIVFDKTGTLTTNNPQIKYDGIALTEVELSCIKTVLRQSNHVLSRKLYDFLDFKCFENITDFTEILGQGLSGKINNHHIKIGSSDYIGLNQSNQIINTTVWIKIDDKVKGKFLFESNYRLNLDTIFKKLQKKYQLIILSGDNDGEQLQLQKLLPKNIAFYFNQKPEQKLEFIKSLQQKNKQVMMVGDGLNDAGALAQSQIGLAVSEDINVFTPACDGIIDATNFEKLPNYLNISKSSYKLIIISFILSFTYNLLGMFFAVQGLLSPIFAAILMPLSSITIVVFVTIGTNIIFKKLIFVRK